MSKRRRQGGATRGRAKRQKPRLTPRQAKYAKARAEGKPRREALEQAGYQYGSANAARVAGHRLDAALRDRGVLDDALRAAGVTPHAIAAVLGDGLSVEQDIKTRLGAAQVAGRWLGFDQPVERPPPGLLDSLTPDDIVAVYRRIADEIAAIEGHRGPAAG